MTHEITNSIERRQIRNEQKLLKQQEGRLAMDEHLANLARERDKSLRLRALRHAALKREQSEAGVLKVKAAGKRARKA